MASSNNKKKILFLSVYPLDTVPGQRFKYEQYFKDLSKKYNIINKPFYSKTSFKYLYKEGFYFHKIFFISIDFLRRFFLIFNLRNYDGAYIFLYVTPFFLIYEKIYIFLLRKFIYDIDDLIYIKTTPISNHAFNFLSNRKEKFFYLIKKANYIITSTDYLTHVVKKYNKNATTISSTIQIKKYKPGKNKNKNKITIGWTGSLSTSKYLNLIIKCLLKIKKSLGCEILIIGADQKKFSSKEVKYMNWSAKDEVKNLNLIDIGLYPLPNNLWVHGKSGLKALQFMALGIPVVATKIATNLNIIKHNYDGFLVKNSTKEWFKYISILIKNKKKRLLFGKRARLKIFNHYSVSSNKYKYLYILKKVFN